MSESATASEDDLYEPVAKRIRLSTTNDNNDETDSGSSRPITPPPLRRGVVPAVWDHVATSATATSTRTIEAVASPFKLTRIRDTQDHNNVDTVTLSDILGDPLIKEMWQFNFLIDIDFTMHVHFSISILRFSLQDDRRVLDPDVGDQVKVNIVHGFWKNDGGRQALLVNELSRYFTWSHSDWHHRRLLLDIPMSSSSQLTCLKHSEPTTPR